jgi:2-keto-4-pentenoate hydratase/2-oxohepta-3-ene-1,7-dioic acid hydratase in catechol pathway
MKILRFRKVGSSPAYGVLDLDGSVRALESSPFDRPGEPIRPGRIVGRIDDVRILPPVTPSKVVMVGANFYSHLEGTPPPEFPMLFLKPPSAVIGHGDTIRVPRIAGPEIDYEAELTVVIGRQTPRHVPESEALSYVLGYTIGNDVSAREWQTREMKTGVLLRGKGFDTFAPLGPVVETDLDPDDVTIEARVNDVLGHRVRTKGDMIFPVRTLIADMTRAFTLFPGDVIMTGTTAYGSIKAGDMVELTIQGIGTLRNPVADEE